MKPAVTPAEKTRRSYERRPYPGDDLRALATKGGSLPSPKWMQAIGRPGCPEPRRILVAGCGTGPEAFQIQRHFPKAEIVAVDFSPRSIALAKRLQKAIGTPRPIEFRVADLTDPDLAAKTGGDFDLATCHGVLSYITEPARVLANLSGILAPRGTLYLGVNGEGHPSTRLRPWLASFGLKVGEMRDERRLRELLAVWDSLHDDGMTELSKLSASYLANDVCGPFINSLPLAQWRAAAGRCGLDLAGVWLLPMTLRLAMEGDKCRPLFPAGIGDLAERLDQVRPAGFHRLLFRRQGQGPSDIPGAGTRKGSLLWTGLYSARFKAARAKGKVTVVLKCPVFDLRLEASLSVGQADALRALVASGASPAGWMARWGRTEAARRLLWLWTGLGVVAGSV